MDNFGSNYNSFYDDYAEWTDTTAQYDVNNEPYYLALGIADESGELLEKVIVEQDGDDRLQAIVKEIGDVCWYSFRYAHRVLRMSSSVLMEQGLNRPVVTTHSPFVELTINIGKIAGIEKKRLRDGDQWSMDVTAAKAEIAKEAITRIFKALYLLAGTYDTRLEDVLRGNMDKLNGRKKAGTIKGDGDNR